jgi:hypothetical protein
MPVAVALVRPVRRLTVGVLQSIVVSHRVRDGLVRAGVADRTGRRPWILGARPFGDAVLVSLWLRAGTTLEDLYRAAPVIEAACGAAKVVVTHRTPRRDRAVLIVLRPR